MSQPNRDGGMIHFINLQIGRQYCSVESRSADGQGAHLNIFSEDSQILVLGSRQ
jgi:hypothetical protein